MKRALVVIIGFIIAMLPVVVAQEVSDETIIGTQAGMTPDNIFYGFKRFSENVGLFFTFDEIAKAKARYNLAKVRLAEASNMAAINRTDLVNSLTTEYENEIGEVSSVIDRLSAAGRNVTDVADLIGNETYKHILVLKRVYEKVPVVAKPAIERVIEKSMERYGDIAKKIEDKESVNITITIGNKTITRTVPQKLAEKFLEKADELREKIKDEVKITEREKLRENIENITATKAANLLEQARELVNEAIETRAEKNVTAFGLINEAKAQLGKAEAAFKEGRFQQAIVHAEVAITQARSALKIQNVKEKIAEKRIEIAKNATNLVQQIREKIKQNVAEKERLISSKTATAITTIIATQTATSVTNATATVSPAANATATATATVNVTATASPTANVTTAVNTT